MGWWGTGILEGDTPCDKQGEIFTDVLGLPEDYYEDDYEHQMSLVRGRLGVKTRVAKLRAYTNRNLKLGRKHGWNSWEGADAIIACQVAGKLVLDNLSSIDRHGEAAATDVIQNARIAAHLEREQCMDDGWDSPRERFGVLTLLIRECDTALGNKHEDAIAASDEADEDVVDLVKEIVPRLGGLVVDLALEADPSMFDWPADSVAEDLIGEAHERIGRYLNEQGLYEAILEHVEQEKARLAK